jgi:hypothetical protein
LRRLVATALDLAAVSRLKVDPREVLFVRLRLAWPRVARVVEVLGKQPRDLIARAMRWQSRSPQGEPTQPTALYFD